VISWFVNEVKIVKINMYDKDDEKRRKKTKNEYIKTNN